MNPSIEKIYYRLPVFLQNVAVSLMGAKLARERFNPAGEEMLTQLLVSQDFSAKQMREYQSQEFVTLARHAINTTEFYRQWATDNKITAADIKSINDLARFPIIEKKFLRINAAKFRSNAPQLQRSQFVLHTSGTTGTPLSVYTDKESRSRHYAFFSRLRASYGVSPDDKRATLFGRIIMLADQNSPPFWRYDAAQKNLLMSSYHLTKDNLIHYYNKLASYKPAEIFAYPSSAFALADFILSQNLPPITLKLVMTTAENLLPQQRAVIEKAFLAPLVNQYGCTEMAFFCSSFPDGDMKFHPEHGISEVRLASGEIAYEGEGELVVTGLINHSMPVIRYAMGDEVSLALPDSHGRQILRQVKGRTDDIIYTRAGAPVGRLDPIFKGGSGIKYAQIIQDKQGDILLKLVPDHDYTDAYGAALKHELIKRVGSETPVTLQVVERIPTGANGKFRPVISEYRK